MLVFKDRIDAMTAPKMLEYTIDSAIESRIDSAPDDTANEHV